MAFDTVLCSLCSCRLCLCVFSKAVTFVALTPPGIAGTGPGLVRDMSVWPVKVRCFPDSWVMKSSP